MTFGREHVARPGARLRAERWVRRETELTWRLLADNMPVCLVPPLLFGLGACLRAQLTPSQIALHLGQLLMLFLLYGYVFDTSNQACGATEDRIDKPYRPIPAGLLSPAGALRRFWLAMAFYTLLGWQLGVLEWVLLWQATVVVLNLLSRPRDYIWVKTPCMLTGTLAQLAAAWQVVTPIDATIWRWLAVIIILFVLALIFEDVRDMAGDRAIGRTTPALLVGPWPVRIWFAVLMGATPVLLHILLYLPTGAPAWRVAVIDLVTAVCCWTAAGRALLVRHSRADRHTYQLYVLSFAISLLAAPILWA